MCAILDRNKFGEVIKPSAEGQHFRDWLDGENGSMVYPVDDKRGRMPSDIAAPMRKLTEEFSSRKLGRALADYQRRGKIRRVGLSEVARKYSDIKVKIRSNDRHILALALASGARLLYTADKKLARDFKNPEIIGNPPGEVYASAADQGRLRPDICKNC